MPTSLSRRLGFTLLELLVVISIIGILVAMGLASFSTAQKQGRDARRRADMKSVQNVMEQFYVSGSTYTGGCSSGAAGITANGQTFTPPKPSEYQCSLAADGASYCACADLDAPSGGNGAGCSGGAITAGSSHFCVKNLQ